jgi:ribosomal protein S18 acetylase RimI-like enzyme
VAPAAAADLPALAELMAASPLLQRYGTSRTRARQALERAQRAGDRMLVARPRATRRPTRAVPGPLAGFAWVVESRILTGTAYLRLLLVAEPWRRTGLGARLLGAAEADAARRANHMVLLVTTDNAGARRFYESHGYRHVGDLPAHAVPGLDEALYEKALRPHGRRLPV